MTRPKATKPTAPTAVVDKSRLLEMQSVDGKTGDRLITDMLAEGIVANASVTVRYAGFEHVDLSLSDMVISLKEQGQAANGGDLSAGERMLSAQAVTLNSMFAELARRAAMNMGTHLQATETYLRLALKAQAQSRATLETLATIKNPPVFARQANINNGGQQQVNNGTGSATAPLSPAKPGEAPSTPMGGRHPPTGAGAPTVEDLPAPALQDCRTAGVVLAKEQHERNHSRTGRTR